MNVQYKKISGQLVPLPLPSLIENLLKLVSELFLTFEANCRVESSHCFLTRVQNQTHSLLAR